MAIGTPIESKGGTLAAQGATSVINPGGTLAVGTFVVLMLTGGASKVASLVVDNAIGNTWTIDHTFIGNSKGVSFVSCKLSTQITATTNITVTWSASTSAGIDYTLDTISGITSSPFDTSADQSFTTTSSFSAGPSATLAQAVEIVLVAARGSTAASTFTAGGGYSKTPFTQQLNTPSVFEYQIVNATTAVTGTGTFNNNQTGAASLATYKGILAPVNTVAPAVTGTTTVGQTLSTTNGTWTDDGSPTFSYQWQRDVHGNGVYSNIGSATSSAYVLVDADDGCNIRCVVTNTDAGGATAANSNAVGTIVEPVPVNTLAPVISGSAPVGSVLSCTQGGWSNMAGFNPSYAYQWTRAGVNIGGATSSSYTTVSADATHAVGCTVTATNTGGNASQASNTITVTSSGGGGGAAPYEGEWGLEWNP